MVLEIYCGRHYSRAGQAYSSRDACNRHSDNGCDKIGLLFYPKCRSGYHVNQADAYECITNPIHGTVVENLGYQCSNLIYNSCEDFGTGNDECIRLLNCGRQCDSLVQSKEETYYYTDVSCDYPEQDPSYNINKKILETIVDTNGDCIAGVYDH